MFNECIQIKKTKEIDKTYQFNPKGFMCDETGTNFKGME